MRDGGWDASPYPTEEATSMSLGPIRRAACGVRPACWRCFGGKGTQPSPLDRVYTVNNTSFMPTVVQSCRIERDHATLLARQAKRRHVEVSTLSSLYLKEKALEEEYPGIGFRDAVGGREAYVLGHRVAVWEVEDVYRETGSIAKTADYFRWATALVRCALAYAKAFPAEVRQHRELCFSGGVRKASAVAG